jgi:hypothetical protein
MLCGISWLKLDSLLPWLKSGRQQWQFRWSRLFSSNLIEERFLEILGRSKMPESEVESTLHPENS